MNALCGNIGNADTKVAVNKLLSKEKMYEEENFNNRYSYDIILNVNGYGRGYDTLVCK